MTRTLKVGPYFFGYLNNPALGDYVDHFPYQDGLLINYWDTSQKNNQTRHHPGAGLVLPIDAHFTALTECKWCCLAQPYPDLRLHLYPGPDGCIAISTSTALLRLCQACRRVHVR